MSESTSPLIGVQDLLARLAGAHPPRLLDVRWKLGGPPGPEAFAAGRLPGAVYVDLDTELAGPADPAAGRHPLPAPEEFERAARSWGLNDGDPVVLYDDAGLLSAARLWWLLRWAGFDGEVRLLDGGLSAWRAAGQELVTNSGQPTAGSGSAPGSASGSAPVPGRVRLGSGRMPTLTPDELPGFVAAGGLLLDARPAGRYTGQEASIDPRPGHIPGALSAPATGNLDDRGHFDDPRALSRRYTELGVEPGRQIGIYCGSGVTATHDLLALAVAGIDPGNMRLYPGSYSQWAADPSRPVVTGPLPFSSAVAQDDPTAGSAG